MAYARDDEGDNFFSQLESVRSELRDKFSLAHRLLQEREEAMLLELQGIEDTYREQVQRQTQQRNELLATKEQLYPSLKGNENRDILQTMLAPLEAKLRELEGGGELVQRIELNWAREGRLEDFMRFICTIKTYKLNADSGYKKKPVLVVCKYRQETDKPGQFKYPTFISINPKTNNIYIGDESNHRIQVFDESCEYLISFSENMSNPAGICFLIDQVYVTQFASNAINVYTENGEFIQSKGGEELQLCYPCGVSGSELHSALYICDRNNNRVQVLDIDLSLKCTIPGFIRPKDVKVTREEIFVLDESNPCIHVYNYEHKLIRKLISFGNTECQVTNSLYFCVDSNSNILITDFSACCVNIFSRNGRLVQRFGIRGENAGEFICPRGIAIDSKCRIIVASRNPNHCIQFFPSTHI